MCWLGGASVLMRLGPRGAAGGLGLAAGGLESHQGWGGGAVGAVGAVVAAVLIMSWNGTLVDV